MTQESSSGDGKEERIFSEPVRTSKDSLRTVSAYGCDLVRLQNEVGEVAIEGMMLRIVEQVPITHEQTDREFLMSIPQFKDFATRMFAIAADLD